MKYLSWIINAVLAVAVAVLFYLHFNKKQPAETEGTEASPSRLARELSIAYINIDTLLSNYAYFQDMQEEFLDKQSEKEAELNSRSRQYEASALDYQNKVQKGLVTRREAAELEQQLMQEQQNLIQLRDQMSMELAEEEQVSNRKIINAIMEYLKEYNQNGEFQFIFSNSFGDNLLFADEQLDITRDVIQGLNQKYTAENAK